MISWIKRTLLKIKGVKRIYNYTKDVCTKLFLRIFPNSELSIEISALEDKVRFLEGEIISTQNNLSVKQITIEDLITQKEERNLQIVSLEKEIESLNQIREMLLEKYYFRNIKIRVGFLVFFYEHWDSLESIYQEMLNDKNIEPLIFIGPRKQFVPEWRFMREAEAFFTEKGIKVICLFDEKENQWDELLKYKLDYIFVNSPWEELFPEKYSIEKLSLFSRVCYIPYGIMAAKFQQYQFNLPFHHRCWKIFAESRLHKQLYAKYSDIKDSNVYVSGYPKLDLFRKYKDQNWDNIWRKRRNGKRFLKRIIWAPHWTEGNVSKFAHASFLRLYKYFYEFAKQNPDIELLIKPHPGLWDNLVIKGLLTRKKVNSIKQSYIDLPNVILYEKPGYFPYFISSDAMILDSISFISEYLPTKKPMLFITKDKLHEFNEYGTIIMDSLYKGWEESDINTFIHEVVVNGKDEMYNKRMKTFNKYVYMPKDSSAKIITKFIINSR